MISASRRYCDTCNVRIFKREPYYTGIAPKGSADDLAANPKGAPSFTPLSGGTLRFEICQRCVAGAPDLVEKLDLTSADV